MTPLDFQELGRLAIALAVGLLIGFERGWSQREIAEGGRVAGVRTFALIGVLGGLGALLLPFAGYGVLLLLGLAVTVFMLMAGWRTMIETESRSITTFVAALLTFGLGALAGFGGLAPAAATGVVVALLLGTKPQLHSLLQRLSQQETLAVLKLLLMSLVLLPLLPNEGFGPWQALNPYRLWWMVILVAGISSAGYFAMRLLGAGRGLLLTALLGGLVSSTAVTLAFARHARQEPAAARLLAAGVLVACGTLFPRLLLIVGLVEPRLVEPLLAPFVLAAAICYGTAASFWHSKQGLEPKIEAGNPFELWPALQFGLLLAGIMLLSRALPAWLGESGHYALAATAGISDVDAIGLNYAQLSGEGSVTVTFAATIVLLAASMNNLVKTLLALGIGGRAMGWRVGLGLMAATAAGFALFFLLS